MVLTPSFTSLLIQSTESTTGYKPSFIGQEGNGFDISGKPSSKTSGINDISFTKPLCPIGGLSFRASTSSRVKAGCLIPEYT